MAIFKEAADIRTADTLDLEKPYAVVKEIAAKPSKIQKRAIILIFTKSVPFSILTTLNMLRDFWQGLFGE